MQQVAQRVLKFVAVQPPQYRSSLSLSMGEFGLAQFSPQRSQEFCSACRSHPARRHCSPFYRVMNAHPDRPARRIAPAFRQRPQIESRRGLRSLMATAASAFDKWANLGAARPHQRYQ